MKTAVQCKHCPWKVSTDPRDIPNGYSVAMHKKLTATIAEPGDMSMVGKACVLRAMACHMFPIGKERFCVGWLAHQLGPGNNIALRLMGDRLPSFETVGRQHLRFEDTMLEDEAER